MSHALAAVPVSITGLHLIHCAFGWARPCPRTQSAVLALSCGKCTICACHVITAELEIVAVIRRLQAMFRVSSTVELFQKGVVYTNLRPISTLKGMQWEGNVREIGHETAGFFCRTTHMHSGCLWSKSTFQCTMWRLWSPPPCSPDLSQPDSFLFQRLKIVLKGQRFASIQEVTSKATRALAKL